MNTSEKILEIKNETQSNANTALRIGEALESIVVSARIIPFGNILFFKVEGNTEEIIEANDMVIGFVEGEFLNAGVYYGGDPLLKASYVDPNQQEEPILV